MRTSIRLILLVWLMSAATAVFAQKGQSSVEQAFEKALNTIMKEGYLTDSEADTYKDGAYAKNYVFAIPEKKKKIIDAVAKALYANSSMAYVVMTNSAGSKGD